MSEKNWQAVILTLFPDLFPGPLAASITGRALEQNKCALDVMQIRDFADDDDKHRSVDDTPAGGGAGMVLRADILGRAIEAARQKCPDNPVYYLSPRGAPFTQQKARALSAGPGVTLLCGRFEGVDQRVLDVYEVAELSLGDFVLSGGEIAAMAMLDACIRLLPGVVGDEQSLTEESFETGLLEYPHYTRPREWRGHEIPEILLSGDHKKIAAWREEQAEELTKSRRPDLWQAYLEKKVN